MIFRVKIVYRTVLLDDLLCCMQCACKQQLRYKEKPSERQRGREISIRLFESTLNQNDKYVLFFVELTMI